MTMPRPARLAGMALGALTLGAAVLLPASLGAGLRPPLEPDGVWLAERPEPGPPGWVEQVDALLQLRMPELGDPERRQLARTLFVEAELARIDPLLVLAVIEVESGWDAGAVSGRGARGLMQVREATLRREAERAGLEQVDPHDPVTNLRAGVRYLRRLLDAFGREEVALMAYNAGPNRILGYLRIGSDEIPERFHAYPRKVLAEVRRLRRAFGEEPAPAVAVADPMSPR